MTGSPIVVQRICSRCPSHALMEEIRQLKGLRKVRLRTFGPGDREIDHLDAMIHARVAKLVAA